MNSGGSIICTGSFSNVGLTYTAVTLTGVPAVPREGYITRVSVTKTGGSGTGARIRVTEPGTSRVVLEVDDEDTPGDPVDFTSSVVNFAVTGRLYYNRGTSALTFEVATDNADTDGTVECEIELPN